MPSPSPASPWTSLVVSAATILLLLPGCPGKSSAKRESPFAPNTVNGLVMNQATGVGLSGAQVSGGGQTVLTDARGYFSLENLPAGQLTLTVTKDGFAPAYATPTAGAQATPSLVTMKASGTAQRYSPTGARTLSQSTEAGPYAVTFAAGSLDTTDTSLTVSITPVDPTKESTVLPGSLVTASATVLFPVTFAEFSILDSAGRRVQLKSGQSATVELPIPPRLRGQYALGTKVHCYAFNAEAGSWDDFVDGEVRTSTVDGTTPVLTAAIKHFSWYGGAPEGNDCFDVVGRVVSAVDGQPLGNARVEASPGASTYTDADGYFTVVASGDATSFFAYQTGFDVDGSLTGMAGAKYIEYGEAEVQLVGLTKKPCTATGGGAPASGKLGTRDQPVVVRLGAIAREAYEVTAILSEGSAMVTMQGGAPKPDGSLNAPTPTSGAKISLSEGTRTASLAELLPGTGLYSLVDRTFAITRGHTYRLDIDADGNGSIDGSGSVSVVGTIALVSPTNGGTYPASGFSVSWTDTGTSVGGAAYSALYMLSATGTGTGWFQMTSGLSATPFDLVQGPGHPLPPGTYELSLNAFSGFATASGDGDFTQSKNITGPGISGTAWSVGQAVDVHFTLQ